MPIPFYLDPFFSQLKTAFDSSTKKYIQRALTEEYGERSLDWKRGFAQGANEMSDACVMFLYERMRKK